MGDMADYYDDRQDGSKEYLQHLLGMRTTQYGKVSSETTTDHLIYQNDLMNEGMSLEERQQLASKQYMLNYNAKVRDKCKCPSCGKEFIKISYQQKFCKSKVKGKSSCKDFFHNFAGSLARKERTKSFIK